MFDEVGSFVARLESEEFVASIAFLPRKRSIVGSMPQIHVRRAAKISRVHHFHASVVLDTSTYRR